MSVMELYPSTTPSEVTVVTEGQAVVAPSTLLTLHSSLYEIDDDGTRGNTSLPDPVSWAAPTAPASSLPS